MSIDYGAPHGTSTPGAAIDRPGDGDGNGDRLSSYARLAGSKVQGMVDQARDKMTEYREHGLGRVQGDVEEYTRSRPLVALGITAALGLFVGWLGSTARRSR